jgi:hypothetical protein
MVLAITPTYVRPYSGAIRFEKCLKFLIKQLGIITGKYRAPVSKEDTEIRWYL